MLKYGKNIVFNPKKLHPKNIDRQSVEQIPAKGRVLEIGCANGFIGKYLIKEKECKVIGVELGKEEAAKARKVLSKVVQGDIEDEKIIQEIKKLGKFDVVYASALIEHLKDPWTALKTWKTFLKKNGLLILTTSNITHWSMRLNIVRGKFNYEQYGILDNTHLRFFTPDTFKKLVIDTGFAVEYYSFDAVGGGFPKISSFLSSFFPNIFAYQMLIKAVPK